MQRWQRNAGKGDHVPRTDRSIEEMRIIKNALWIKKLGSTDPVYIAHRTKVLGRVKT